MTAEARRTAARFNSDVSGGGLSFHVISEWSKGAATPWLFSAKDINVTVFGE